MLSALLAAFLLMPAADSQKPGTVPVGPDPIKYRIGSEDVLIISVWQNAELSRTVQVRPDGKISLPLLNDVQAEGRTPMELRQSLIDGLKEYAPSTVVSVIVSEVNSFKVSVLGRVQRPDRYKLRGPATVLDVLAMAGGFQDWANTDDVIVMRPEPFPSRGGGSETMFKRIKFNYKKAISPGGESENFAVQSNDIVVVP